MSLSLEERRLRVRVGRAALEDLARRDPLRTYQHSSWASEWICRHVHEAWVYWHAANSGGKSRSLGALDVALLRGAKTLGGIDIPVIKPPVHGAMGTPTYKLGAAGSVIDVVRSLIGSWPHHEERVAGSVSVFHVMHQDQQSDAWQDWSKLYVFPYEGPLPEGARLDFWHADEPPPELWLSAILNRGKAGRRLYGYIGATPVRRRDWAPIRDQFPKAHCAVIEGRARVQSSVYDNRFLTTEDIQRQEQANPSTHPLSRAKLLGEHVDASGECPFDIATIYRMIAEWCDGHEPKVVNWRITSEDRDEQGQPRLARVVPVEVFKPVVPGLSYRCTIDPSSGVDDNRHDPYELEISEIGSGDLCVRSGGYLAGKLVGILGAGLCRQYNNALADPEVNDRWGVNVIEGFNAAHYGNFAREPRELRPGEFVNEIGFHNTAKTRPIIIGAVQAWIEAFRAGTPYGVCRSRKVFEQLLDTILDEMGKEVAAPGLHDECLIVRGQQLRTCVTGSGRYIPEVYRPPLTRIERVAREIAGVVDEDDYEAPFGQAVMGFPAAPGV